MLLMLSLSALWVGCNASCKDIVGERGICEREYDVNLMTTAFYASKLIVAGAFALIQVAIIFALSAASASHAPAFETAAAGGSSTSSISLTG